MFDYEYEENKSVDFSSLSQEEQELVLNALGEFHTNYEGKIFDKEQIEG